MAFPRRRPAAVPFLLFCALAALAGTACRRAEPRPSIVLISIDTLRSDRLPAYGYAHGRTPSIDRLARDGVLFERAFAQVPLTLPSHASLMTGLLPPEHGVRNNVGFSLAADRGTTLAELLRAGGHATGAAVSSFVLRADTGIARGFERYDAPEGPERPATETLKPLLGWLEEWRARPFFLFFHLYEPHTPYEPPADLAGSGVHPYDGEIAAADRAVGELLAALDRLGLYDEALVVLLSDHGEGLGDHGEEEHGFLLYREAIQVPLIVKLPGGERAGERVRRSVGLTDLVPTLAERAGLAAPPGLPGQSLLDEDADARKFVYSETFATFIHFSWSELLSAVGDRFHYIEGPAPELFDLDADPGETTNLIARERRAGADLRAFLEPFPRQLEAPAEADPETLAKLGALGYLSGAAAPPAAGPRKNPRDELPRMSKVLSGIRLVHERRYREAVEVLRAALEQEGSSAVLGWEYLARALDALGEREEAARARAKGPPLSDTQAALPVSAAMRLLDLGRSQEALDLVRRDLKRAPASADLLMVESRALLVLGRPQEALASAEAAVAGAPDKADPHYQRAVVQLTLGRADLAEADLRAALAAEPRHVQAAKALAVIRFRLGDRDEARRLLERVLELAPGDPDATEGLAALRRGAA